MLKQITALRGLAILLIILFHLAPQSLPYGYFGVEVFLVISGYLLMLSFQKQGCTLPLVEFARKKLIRLFVPIAALLLLAMLAGVFILDYTDLETTCKTATYTLKGNANGYLARLQADYFAPEASSNPLLHMWYVAVTVHVYLLFAAGCVLHRFLPRRVLTPLLWAVGIASFLWAASYPIHNLLAGMGLPVWEQDGPVSHYMTLPRLWEPLAGIWLATLPPPAMKGSALRADGATLLGLLLILIPALSWGEGSGYCAALVVIGTCLIIRYATEGHLARVLNNKVLLWLGSISFSLYLVHMPLIAFWHSWFFRAPDAAGMLIIFACSIGIGNLFYRLVEKPKAGWKTLIIIYALAMVLATIGRKTEGLKNYVFSDINNSTASYVHNATESNTPGIYDGFDKAAIPFFSYIHKYACADDFQGDRSARLVHMGVPGQSPGILLTGDSHAAHSFPGLDAVLKELGLSGTYLASTIYPFWDCILPNADPGYDCRREKIRALSSWLSRHPEIHHIIISMRWSTCITDEKINQDWNMRSFSRTPAEYKNRLRRFISELRGLGKNVILLSPTPYIEQKDPPKMFRMLARRGISTTDGKTRRSLQCSREQYINDHKTILTMFEELEQEGMCTVISMQALMPEGQLFETYDDGEILYEDYNHLSTKGSMKIFSTLKPQLKKALEAQPTASPTATQP